MSYKKRPKNKQELTSKSGKRIKKELPKKYVLDFQFTTIDGTSYKPPMARIKTMPDGAICCLLSIENKWKPVKAKLDYVKIKTIIIRKETIKK